jgi:hypothetical protein
VNGPQKGQKVRCFPNTASSAGASSETPALAIEQVLTLDFAGEPVLPFAENYDADFFAVVRRLPDRKTLWRKISLAHARETPPPSRGILGGMRKDKTS